MKKGIIYFLEFVFVAIALFISFAILFPRFSYTSRWDEANLLVIGRDTLLTADRIGNLYDYSFNFNNFTNLTETLLPKFSNNILFWTETQNSAKNTTIIACNCSQQMIDNLNSWFNGMRFNGRDVRVLIIQTNLEEINNPSKTSDVLFISGYKSLDIYYDTIKEFMSQRKGVVEMMDFTDAGQVDNDRVQKSIFGLKWVNLQPNNKIDYDEFRKKPDNSSDITYQPYKLFHNIPVPIFLNQSTSFNISVEAGLTTCENRGESVFYVGDMSFNFWLCKYGSVYFDTDRDGAADRIVYQGENFTLNNLGTDLNFTLSYVVGERKIGISFDWKHRLDDFIRTRKDVPADPGAGGWGLYYSSTVDTVEGTKDRVLVQSNVPRQGGTNIPAVILNSTGLSNVVYIADFDNDRDVVGDDHRLLLMSLLMWASNKNSVSSAAMNLKTGRMTSYINIMNQDFFEIYRLNLGVGRPF